MCADNTAAAKARSKIPATLSYIVPKKHCSPFNVSDDEHEGLLLAVHFAGVVHGNCFRLGVSLSSRRPARQGRAARRSVTNRLKGRYRVPVVIGRPDYTSADADHPAAMRIEQDRLAKDERLTGSTTR